MKSLKETYEITQGNLMKNLKEKIWNNSKNPIIYLKDPMK